MFQMRLLFCTCSLKGGWFLTSFPWCVRIWWVCNERKTTTGNLEENEKKETMYQRDLTTFEARWPPCSHWVPVLWCFFWAGREVEESNSLPVQLLHQSVEQVSLTAFQSVNSSMAGFTWVLRYCRPMSKIKISQFKCSLPDFSYQIDTQ